jgi:HPt (histidine-containing phosphotransfer) domain-containing protein
MADFVMDRELALSRVGGDAQLLRELAVLFLEEYPRVLGELRSAVDRGDAAAVERAAHALKGCIANFGAQAAVETAFRVEALGRDRKLQEVSQAVQSLELALIALQTELAGL